MLSPFFVTFTTERLERALEARKRELEDGSPAKRAEAARGIRTLEKELEARKTDERAID